MPDLVNVPVMQRATRSITNPVLVSTGASGISRLADVARDPDENSDSTSQKVTYICSRPLALEGLNISGANHAYIDDTGGEPCQGDGKLGYNYALSPEPGSELRGCANKTTNSSDPQGTTPKSKRCEPKSGTTVDCLKEAYEAYAEPSEYSNEAVAAGGAAGGLTGLGSGAAIGFAVGGPLGALIGGVVGGIAGAFGGAHLAGGVNGPNSNTFAATLAKECCADASASDLGWVPGWDHEPAGDCSNE